MCTSITCSHAGGKMNSCVRWKVCVYIHIDIWMAVIKLNIACYECRKQHTCIYCVLNVIFLCSLPCPQSCPILMYNILLSPSLFSFILTMYQHLSLPRVSVLHVCFLFIASKLLFCPFYTFLHFAHLCHPSMFNPSTRSEEYTCNAQCFVYWLLT